MSNLSDLLNSGAVTARQAAERASTKGIRLPYGTIAAYWSGRHGKPSAATLAKLAQVVPFTESQLQNAAWGTSNTLGPYSPPDEAALLDHRQRLALDELIRSIVATRGQSHDRQSASDTSDPPAAAGTPRTQDEKTTVDSEGPEHDRIESSMRDQPASATEDASSEDSLFIVPPELVSGTIEQVARSLRNAQKVAGIVDDLLAVDEGEPLPLEPVDEIIRGVTLRTEAAVRLADAAATMVASDQALAEQVRDSIQKPANDLNRRLPPLFVALRQRAAPLAEVQLSAAVEKILGRWPTLLELYDTDAPIENPIAGDYELAASDSSEMEQRVTDRDDKPTSLTERRASRETESELRYAERLGLDDILASYDIRSSKTADKPFKALWDAGYRPEHHTTLRAAFNAASNISGTKSGSLRPGRSGTKFWKELAAQLGGTYGNSGFSLPSPEPFATVARTRDPRFRPQDPDAYDNSIGEAPDPEGPEGGA